LPDNHLPPYTRRPVALSLGGRVYDATDPVGRLLFNVLGMVAELEADLIRMRTREGMAVAKAKGRLQGKKPKLRLAAKAPARPPRRRGPHTGRTGRAVQHSCTTAYRELHRV